ncbi:radical SAM protein [Desulfovibrio sp. OttesenSCG-928-M14]|nr:radical SAM protein [Desulfovibrio sp. OttesenSCG-928-M14]
MNNHTVAFLSNELCPRRVLELERVKNYLSANGYGVQTALTGATMVFFYGCAFNADNEKQSLRKMREIAKSDAELCVIGGLAELYTEDELSAMAGRAVRRLSLRCCEALDSIVATKVPFAATPPSNSSPFRPGHWSIQIGRGCDSACSYCGDKKIVGPLRSLLLEEITRQFEQGLEAGYLRFDLVGDDVGAWGCDFGSNFCLLLEKLVSYPCEFALSLQEVNAKYLIRHCDVFERILESGKITSMMLAFQHVNDRILGLMDRGYNGAGVRKLAAMLRRQRVRVHFHAILGFPSETSKELAENLTFITEQKFASGSCFLYQSREYAPASRLPGQLGEEEKNAVVEKARAHLAKSGYLVRDHYPDYEMAPHINRLPDVLRLERGEGRLPDLFADGRENFTHGKPLPDFGPYGVIRRFSRIVIEPTTFCPNKCIFCKYRLRSNKGTMSPADLEHLMCSLPEYAGPVEFGGGGEPLLLEELPEYIHLVKSHWPNAVIKLFTSLSLPRSRDYFVRLLRAGVEQFNVSCYAYTEDDYVTLFGRDALAAVMANLHTLGPLAWSFDSDVCVHTFFEPEKIFSLTHMQQKEMEFTRHLEQSGITHIIRKGVYSGLDSLRLANVPFESPPNPCSVVWGHRANELAVGWNLDVWPCCLVPETEHRLGNLRENSLADIYTSARYRAFYERHWKGDIADMAVCRECSHPNHNPSQGELTRLASYEGQRLASKDVYFWGCGEAYRAYRVFFGQTKPQCILYDAPGPRPETVDGIPVRHPDEVLPNAKKLPLILFSFPQHTRIILKRIREKYPHYDRLDITLCVGSIAE